MIKGVCLDSSAGYRDFEFPMFGYKPCTRYPDCTIGPKNEPLIDFMIRKCGGNKPALTQETSKPAPKQHLKRVVAELHPHDDPYLAATIYKDGSFSQIEAEFLQKARKKLMYSHEGFGYCCGDPGELTVYVDRNILTAVLECQHHPKSEKL